MADWKEWLQKGKDWAGKQAGAYRAADQETSGLGAELADRMKSQEAAKSAISSPMPQMMPSVQPAEMTDPGSGVTAVNPGYKAIGGQNALDALYAGQPPALLPSPAAKRSSFAHAGR